MKNNFEVKEVTSADERSQICNQIIRALPNWFGIESAIVDYVNDVKEMPTWAAYFGQQAAGFISINKHNSSTAEIHVIGVSEKYHQQGLGKSLIQETEKALNLQNYKYLTVKTLSELRVDEYYEKTRQFYLAVGFAPVEVFKTLWGEHNPCLLMIKNIGEPIISKLSDDEKMSVMPILKTNRLNLRPFVIGDAKEVQRQAGNAKVAVTTGAIPHPYPDGLAEQWIGRRQEMFKNKISTDWAIELNSTNQLIGCMSLIFNRAHQRAELGYWIGEEFWASGYGTEAAVEVVRYGFENLSLNKITARHVPENMASGKILQKVGMKFEGHLKQEFLKDGRFLDLIVYGILKNEYVGFRIP